MIANYNTTTGIPFGVISGNSLQPEVLDELMFGPQARNLTYEGCREDFLREQRAIFEMDEEDSLYVFDGEFDENSAVEAFNEQYQGDEEHFEGELDGVSYAVSWLGGAIIVFIYESPYVVKCAQCSPCVPGAGDLNNDGDYEAYGVPEDWKRKEAA